MANQILKHICSNSKCEFHGKTGNGNISSHGYVKNKTGKRRRYICRSCGKTFSSTKGSAYYRLRASRNEVDLTCHMSAEGVNISAISRVSGRTWNTTNRWLERTRSACHRYQEKHLRGYDLSAWKAGSQKSKTQ